MSVASLARASRRRDRPRRGAFSIVELLVVIGMLAVAASVLLPSLNRARDSAKNVQCLSNLRQLAMATVMYANDNNSLMPAGAEASSRKRWDWIYWDASASEPALRDSGRSALAPYLGGARLSPGRFSVSPQVLRCPADRMDLHPAAAVARGARYEYSYAMNAFLCDNGRAYQYGLGLADSERDRWANFRISLIRRPGHKVLFIDRAERTSGDGLWVPAREGAGDPDPACNELSDRHEFRKAAGRAREGRGNVSFVDGHAEFVSRVEVEVNANTLPLEE